MNLPTILVGLIVDFDVSPGLGNLDDCRDNVGLDMMTYIIIYSINTI